MTVTSLISYKVSVVRLGSTCHYIIAHLLFLTTIREHFLVLVGNNLKQKD